MKLHIAALIISMIQFGCASVPLEVPMGDPQQDAALKTFAVAPDGAGLYIYRNQSLVMDVRTDIQLDGTPLGQTAAMTYLYTPVAPGRHTVTSSADNADTLEVDVKPGALAYVRQEVEVWADSPQARLHRVREEEGRSGVLECGLAPSKATTQVIEVRVEADDPAWAGPLECQASNSFGIWQFSAPGTVSVQPAVAPLHLTCNVPPGSEMETSATATAPGAHERLQEAGRKGAATGAAVGAGAGVALGVAAAPVMGPLFAIVLGVGSAFRGAEIGGVMGVMSSGDLTADDELLYPSPIAIHIRRMATSN